MLRRRDAILTRDYTPERVKTEQILKQQTVFQSKQIHSLMTVINKMGSTISMSTAEPKIQRKFTTLVNIADKINRVKNDEQFKEVITELSLA